MSNRSIWSRISIHRPPRRPLGTCYQCGLTHSRSFWISTLSWMFLANIGTVWKSASRFLGCAIFLFITISGPFPDLAGKEQTLDTIHTSFPRVVAPYLPTFVTAALHHLHALYPTYVRYYLTDSVAVPNSSEGEPIELYKLITPLLDFVTIATRQSKARVSFDQEMLGKLVDALVRWAQMTKENVSWAALFRGVFEPPHTLLSRKKNGRRTRICSYLKRKTILRCTVCGSLSLICSRYVSRMPVIPA